MEDNHYALEGEGYFDVVHNPDRSFVVEAGGGSVAVLGTEFVVYTWADTPGVYLKDGSVSFTDENGRSVTLAPGEAAQLTADGPALQPALLQEGEYLDWLENELRFTQRPLREILPELAFHFSIELEVDPSLLDDTYSGPIPIENRHDALEMLGLVIDPTGRFVDLGNQRFRFETD